MPARRVRSKQSVFLIVRGQSLTSLKVQQNSIIVHVMVDTQVLCCCFMSANLLPISHLPPISLSLMMFEYQESPSSKPSRMWTTPVKWVGWSHSGPFVNVPGWRTLMQLVAVIRSQSKVNKRTRSSS